jgi:type IV pilus biogenesis protein PilP
MQNKNMLVVLFALFGMVSFDASYAENADVFLEEEVVENIDEQANIESVAAAAIENYDVEGSLFQQITTLEQEKILMQLEKERAQLDLELDRLAAEKIKLHMEIDTLSGRAEQQQQEIETQKAKLEAEAVKLEREKERLQEEMQNKEANKNTGASVSVSEKTQLLNDIAKSYRLVNVVGAGSQLQATVEDLSSGQTKRVSVGKVLDGWKVKSISLDEGVVFVNDEGETQNLNVSNGK